MRSREGFVSDGHRAVSYAKLQDGLPAWDAWLERSGVARHECVALPTRTDAQSSATLFALLTRGQSVLLWRQPIAVERDRLVAGALPPFCRTALVEKEDEDSMRGVTTGPDRYRVVRCDRESGLPADDGSPYVYLPTSGTTGKPKIVAYEPKTLLDNARNCVSRLQLDATDRVLIPVPLAHMYGLGAAFLPSISVGSSVRLVSDANLLNYVRAEAEFDPTVVFLTPTFCHLLVKGRKQSRPYRLTVLAGDRTDPQMFSAYEQRHGCTINLYGSTELGAVCAGSPDDSFQARRDTAGTPLPGVSLAPPDDEVVASRQTGQPFPFRFNHPHGCAGYADENGKPLRPPSLYRDGWYCTPDMGRKDRYGRVRLAGRFDQSVKRDGFLVAFADVESALQRLDAVERAVIVPGGMTPRGRELVAVCTVPSGVRFDSALLRRSALRLLPGHAVPDRFVFAEELPLTATAKPDRLAVAAMVSEANGGSA